MRQRRANLKARDVEAVGGLSPIGDTPLYVDSSDV